MCSCCRTRWSVIILLMITHASAIAGEIKTMECDTYVVGPGGIKDKWSTFTFRLDAKKTQFSITLQKDGGLFRLPEGGEWRVLWKSSDNLRAVATFVREIDTERLESPVLILDLDYKNVIFKRVDMGGALDFDKISYDPWKYECRRLD
jgi:hypothetical protein